MQWGLQNSVGCQDRVEKPTNVIVFCSPHPFWLEGQKEALAVGHVTYICPYLTDSFVEKVQSHKI